MFYMYSVLPMCVCVCVTGMPGSPGIGVTDG